MTKERTSVWVRLAITKAGRLGLVASEGGLVLSTLPGRSLADLDVGSLPAARRQHFQPPAGRESEPPLPIGALLDRAEGALVEYYAAWPDYPGQRVAQLWSALLALPVDLDGLTSFTRKVLELLRQVPPGKVVRYGELAARAGSPRAARAVGSVMARNPLPIILPCHRVVSSDGSLGGFCGDTLPDALAFKERLLRYEGWEPDKGSRPRAPGLSKF